MRLSFWEPITSPGRFQESYKPAPKASGAAEASETPAANAPLSAQRMRATLSSQASTAAVLQRRLQESGAEMVAVESATEIPRDGGREREAQRANPALPGAC
jgi:ribosomal protein S11